MSGDHSTRNLLIERLIHSFTLVEQPELGQLELKVNGHTVQVSLPSKKFTEFEKQLDEQSIPALVDALPAERTRIKSSYIYLWIRELVESDSNSPVTKIALLRDRDGLLHIDAIRAQGPSNSVPPRGADQYWDAQSD